MDDENKPILPWDSEAVKLLKSLWNDTGLRQVMRPDQVNRIRDFLKNQE